MSQRKVVVSNLNPIFRRLRWAGVAVVFIVVAALMYEYGLSRGGFSRIGAIESKAQLEEENRKLKKQNKRLSEQLAVLQTAAKIDLEAYGKVESELVDLQSRILEQQEDIEFYKGIVNENDGNGLRIQDFRISQGFAENEFALRLVLAQAFRSTRQVSGQVEMVVEGMQSGAPARLNLGDISADSAGSGNLGYSFRYFQDMKAEVVIPADFVPERVHVIVHLKGKTPKTVEDFFVWDVKPG